MKKKDSYNKEMLDQSLQKLLFEAKSVSEADELRKLQRHSKMPATLKQEINNNLMKSSRQKQLAWSWLAGLSLASAVIILITFLVFRNDNFKNNFHNQGLTKVYLKGDNLNVDLSKSFQRVKHKKVLTANINKSLTLQIRNVHGLSAKLDKKNLIVGFNSGHIRFKYKRNTDTPKVVTINTPFLQLKITGTDFIVQSTKHKSEVLLKKGEVVIYAQDKKITLSSYQEFNTIDLKVNKLKRKKTNKYFHNFKNKNLSKLQTLFKKKFKTKKRLSKRKKSSGRNMIFIHEGRRRSGRIIYEDSEKTIVKTKDGEKITIPKDSINEIR